MYHQGKLPGAGDTSYTPKFEATNTGKPKPKAKKGKKKAKLKEHQPTLFSMEPGTEIPPRAGKPTIDSFEEESEPIETTGELQQLTEENKAVIAKAFESKGKSLTDKNIIFSMSLDQRMYTPREAQKIMAAAIEDGYIRETKDGEFEIAESSPEITESEYFKHPPKQEIEDEYERVTKEMAKPSQGEAIADLYISIYKSLRERYKESTGEYPLEYKSLHRDDLVDFFNTAIQLEDMGAESFLDYLYSTLIIEQFLPNMNHRTATTFVDGILNVVGMSMDYSTTNIDVPLSRYFRKSKWIIREYGLTEEGQRRHLELTNELLSGKLPQSGNLSTMSAIRLIAALKDSGIVFSQSYIDSNNAEPPINNLAQDKEDYQ